MRDIQNLVLHCTATSPDHKLENIQHHWHKVLGWKNPGYHYIVLKDGTIKQLLSEDKVANGARGHNHNSIHISYIGGVLNSKAVDTRTPEQEISMLKLLVDLKSRYPKAKVLGHRDFSPDKNGNGKVDMWERIKECPCFDAIEWVKPNII